MAYPISKIWFYPFMWMLMRRVKGMENIPDKTTFIIVSNHEKLIDPLYVLYPILKKLNKKVRFLAMPTWWFLGDKICRQWAGCIPLFDAKNAYVEAQELVKSGRIVGIFPEGHINSRIRYPKTGAVRLALETNTPILPIGLKSSYLPFNSTLHIGKPIYLRKNKNIKKQTFELVEHIYKLKIS